MSARTEQEAPVRKSLSLEILETLEPLPIVGWSPVQRRVEFEDHQEYMTARVVDGFKTLLQFLRKDLASLPTQRDFEPVVLENGALLNNKMTLPPTMIASQFEVIFEKVTPLAPESVQFLSPYRLKVAIPIRGSFPGTVQVEADGHHRAEGLWEVLEREISERSERAERGEGSIAINSLAETLGKSKSIDS